MYNVSFVRSSKVTNGIGNHEWPLGPYKYHCFRFQPQVRTKIALKIAKNHHQFHCMGFGKKSGNEKWHFCYEVHEKNSSNRNATGYKWVLVTCWASTNTHLYHVALRFDEFFHGIFKTPRKTNGNLKLVVLLVESNTMRF